MFYSLHIKSDFVIKTSFSLRNKKASFSDKRNMCEAMLDALPFDQLHLIQLMPLYDSTTEINWVQRFFILHSSSFFSTSSSTTSTLPS